MLLVLVVIKTDGLADFANSGSTVCNCIFSHVLVFGLVLCNLKRKEKSLFILLCLGHMVEKTLFILWWERLARVRAEHRFGLTHGVQGTGGTPDLPAIRA